MKLRIKDKEYEFYLLDNEISRFLPIKGKLIRWGDEIYILVDFDIDVSVMAGVCAVSQVLSRGLLAILRLRGLLIMVRSGLRVVLVGLSCRLRLTLRFAGILLLVRGCLCCLRAGWLAWF